jgi:multiple sugar transport system ATP-binding protein
MGRSIVRDAYCFLFDEPLSNLDAKLRASMRTELSILHKRLERTMIYVTHDQIEAMTMADKIVVMEDGLVEQVGTPLELFDEPKNVFVATFIGSPAMNLIQGTLRRGGSASVEANGHRFPVGTDRAGEEGQSVVYGVRPEHLDIGEEGDGFPARVSVVEPTGSETLVFLRFGETEVVALFRDRYFFKPGETVHLRPRSDQTHLFDSATGVRL